MSRLNAHIVIGVVLTFLFSCSNKSVDAIRYLSYLSDKQNGLHQIVSDSTWEYDIQYKTPEALALQDSYQDGILEKEKMHVMKDQFGKMQYFFLRVKALKKSDSLSTFISNNVEHFDFGMQKEFFLISDTDTLPCQLYSFENTFSITGYASVAIGFDCNKPINSDLQLIFNRTRFNYAPLIVQMKLKDIRNIPTLKI